MCLAAIDVGSNTIRMLMGRVEHGKVKPFIYERMITRLAAGMDFAGRLSETAMVDTLSALRRYSEKIRDSGALLWRAVGTGALREAENSEDFISLVKSETGLQIEVISGEAESELMAMGVMSSMPALSDAFILDIGGASTEMLLVKEGEIRERHTAPVGVVRLLERHVNSDPPSASDIGSLEAEAAHVAEELRDSLQGRKGSDAEFVGTAGTATTLAAIDLGLKSYEREKVHLHAIPLQRLRNLWGRLSSMPLDERSRVDGLEPGRADLIIPGITFTIKIMEAFGFDNLVVSDSGLLEGVLIGLSREGAT